MKYAAGTVVVFVMLACAFANAGPPARVTYIANEGFLIEVGLDKVMIDGIYDDGSITYAHVPDDETLSLMTTAEAPFDDIDALLVTHSHRDHFSPAPVLKHLESNPSAVLVGPPQMVEMLEAMEPGFEGFGTTVREVDLGLFESEDLEVGEIRVRATRLRHSAYMETDETTGEQVNRHEDVENLVYLVELWGRTILHVGDATLDQNLELFEDGGFQKQKIDIVFLEFFDGSDETVAIVERWMTPDRTVFMHLPPDPQQIRHIEARLQEQFPNVVVFAEPMSEKEL